MKTFATFLLACACVYAQKDVVIQRQVVMDGAVPPPHLGAAVTMALGGIEADLKPVANAPFTADAVTEFTQNLGDGNRIHRVTTTHVARDSQGRTRREEAIGANGPLSGVNANLVFIRDSVAGTRYVLNPADHTAIKSPAEPPRPSGGIGIQEAAMASPQDIAKMKAAGGPPARMAFLSKLEAEKRSGNTVSLGTQAFDGIIAEGKRMTVTIAAGEAGNDRPIEIVTETWYSPELQTVVMSKHSDPRIGETVSQLKNIQRAEPDPALFQIPADYTMKEGGNVFYFKLKD